MPVSLQQFFNSANTVGDSASLFLQNGGESVGDTSSLHGIHKLSRSAKAEENRATVTAFLNALDQSPQFRNINADIRGMLNAKLEGGKPLTAEDVKLVRDSVLYDEALAAGRQLADGNALPAGHATSFAQRLNDMSALEVVEAVEVLKGLHGDTPLAQLSFRLAAEMLLAGGGAASLADVAPTILAALGDLLLLTGGGP